MNKETKQLTAVLPASGQGSRLRPITDHIAKQEIMIADKPLLWHTFHAIEATGITTAIVRTNSRRTIDLSQRWNQHTNSKLEVITSFGENQGAIDILNHTRHLPEVANTTGQVVIFPDVLFQNQHELNEYIKKYYQNPTLLAMLAAQAAYPPRHATPYFNQDQQVTHIIEKDQNAPHNYVITTWDIFSTNMLQFLPDLTPSQRGELEISDYRNRAINEGIATIHMYQGEWIDTGTAPDVIRSNRMVFTRDFPQQPYFVGDKSDVTRSHLYNASISGNVHLTDCTVEDCIIMASANLKITNEHLQNMIILDELRLPVEV